MRFEVDRLTMLEAAKNVAKIAPTSSPVEILNRILVESNDNTGEIYMTATNREVSIQQKVVGSIGESGAVLVNPRLLIGMMSLLEGEVVTFSADRPENLKVVGGKCTYHINCLPSNRYPKPIMPFPEESVLLTGICSIAKRTIFAVSKDKSKPALQCVNVKLKNSAVHATATDGMRMMLVKDSAVQTEEQEFLLPGRSLEVLASISSDSDVFEVSDIGNEIVFVRGDMIFTINKLTTGSYMDTTAVVKSIKSAYVAVANASDIKEALDLIAISALAGSTKKPINLILTSDEIILKCNNDTSESSTVVPAIISQGTAKAGFFYDVSALIKLFQVVAGKVRIEIDAKGFMLIKTRSEVYLQAPMHPPKKKKSPVKAAAKSTKEVESAKGAEGVKEVA